MSLITGIIGFILGYTIKSIMHGVSKEDTATKNNGRPLLIGPCPRCRVACNLEEWRCGSCNYQLHKM